MKTKADLIALVFLAFSVQSFAKNEAYVNPLKGDINVHDPVLAKEGSAYYVFFTGALIQGKSSPDRVSWKNSGSTLSPAPAWFKQEAPGNDGTDCWAPDISFRNGMWWLYYAVSSFGKNTSAIGLATNATLNPAASNYKWVDKGVVIKSVGSDNYNCIDPNAFTDSDSTVWLAFGSWWSGIKLTQLNPQTGKPISATPTLISLASHSGGIEAPFIIKWKGYYYLFVSWDVCCQGAQSTYKIVVGRASALKGPYVDKTNTPMLSGGGLKLDTGDDRWKGPGHNGILIDHDSVICINHAYDANNSGAPTMMIRPLYWDSGNWPTFTKPVDIRPNSSLPAIKSINSPGIFYNTPETLRKIRASAGGSTAGIFTVSGKKVTDSFLKTSGANGKAIPGIFIIDVR